MPRLSLENLEAKVNITLSHSQKPIIPEMSWKMAEYEALRISLSIKTTIGLARIMATTILQSTGTLVASRIPGEERLVTFNEFQCLAWQFPSASQQATKLKAWFQLY